MKIVHHALAVVLTLSLAAPLSADIQVLQNGSMELGPGPGGVDPQVADKWAEFGTNVERSPQYNFTPAGAGHSLKAFGDGTSTSCGAVQEILNVAAGSSVSVSARLFSPANDKLRGSGQAGIVFEFLSQFGSILSTQNVYPLDVNTPADTWVTASFGPLTAPALTNKVRITCRLQWSLGDVLGAAYWDDVHVVVNSVEKALNGNFETAGLSQGQSSVGIDNWTGFNDQEKSGLFAHTGSYSLQLGYHNQYSGLYQNTQVFSAGQQLRLNGRLYVPSTDAPNNTWRAGIKLEFAANGEVPPPAENLAFDANSPEDQWVLVSLNTTVPTLATQARIVCIYFADGGSSGEVHFDSARAERSSAPGVNQLQGHNESFEFGPGGPGGLDDWTEFNSTGSSSCQKSCDGIFDPNYLAQSGDCTARATGTAVAGVFQAVNVAAGETLTASVYIRSPSLNPLNGGTSKAGIKVEWVAGSVPPQVDIGTPNSSPNTIGPGCATNTWIPVSIDYTMPPGSNAIARYVCLIEKGTSTIGHVYFDSCELIGVGLSQPGDADGDGDVDQDDLDLTLFNFGTSGWPPNTNGDVDGDGDVDQDDLDLVLFYFGSP